MGNSDFHSSYFRRTIRISLAMAGLAVLAAGCVDEDGVFNDRPFTDDPPADAGGVLGYAQGAVGSTTCGQCHAASQSEWSGTAHAGAWETLQGSGLAQPSCENCHTVSQLGNAETEDIGWPATADKRYLDVQCESCHGGGAAHVSNPVAVKPVPSLAVGTDLTDGCGECHNGGHHPFVEQWELSKHAEVVTEAAGRAECAACHRGQGTLLAWGVKGDYLEKDSEEPLPVVCGVCHDPHNAAFEGQLRFPVNTNSPELHLCARCHNRRSIPDPTSSHGLEPHSPETELLLGDAGWIPPGADIDRGSASHGSANNDRLCATCHVVMYEITDAASGEFVFKSVGHTFQPIPCVDAQGIPNGDDSCLVNADARSFRGCVDSGCHSSEESASALLNLRADFIGGLAEDLITLLEEVDPNLDEPGGEIDPTVGTFTVAEGAFFNYNLAIHNGGEVYGSTTHNPFLIRELLQASIGAVNREYGVALP